MMNYVDILHHESVCSGGINLLGVLPNNFGEQPILMVWSSRGYARHDGHELMLSRIGKFTSGWNSISRKREGVMFLIGGME